MDLMKDLNKIKLKSLNDGQRIKITFLDGTNKKGIFDISSNTIITENSKIIINPYQIRIIQTY